MVVNSVPSLGIGGIGGLASLTLKAGGGAFGLRTAAQVAQAAQTWGLRGTAATAGLQTFGGMYGDAAQGFWKNLLLNVPKHALADIPQELPDELFSQMMSALATNHDADLGKVAADFIKNSPQLIAAIALMGGAGGAVQTQQQFKNSAGQTQMEESADSKPRDETKQPPAAEPSIPDTTTDESPSSEKPPAALPGNPSRPPLDVETSKKLITNVEKIQKHRPLNPVEQADLDQARRVVAEDEQQRQAGAAQNARPSTPPLSVEQSQKLIHNVMNRPPEQRGHPTTQADLAQAQWVVREQVRKLESQKEPRSETQEKALADAKAALARGDPSLPSKQHVSGGRPELPEGAKLLQSSEHFFIFDQGGKKWVRFYAPEARSPNGAKKGGRGDGHDNTAAYLTPEGNIYVEEGQHRLNDVVQEGNTNLSSVPGHPKWLEYEYKGDTDAIGEVPKYNPGEPHVNENGINPWDGMDGY